MELIITICFVIAVFPWFMALWKASKMPGMLMYKLILFMFFLMICFAGLGQGGSSGDYASAGALFKLPLLMLLFAGVGFGVWMYTISSYSKHKRGQKENTDSERQKK